LALGLASCAPQGVLEASVPVLVSKPAGAVPKAPAFLPVAEAPPPPDSTVVADEMDVVVHDEPTVELPHARTRRLGAYHEDRYALAGFDPQPAFYRDGASLVVRWWVEHLCEQRVRPRVERRGEVLVLHPGLGPPNRCMPELSLFETRVADPRRELHDLELVQSGTLRSLDAAPRVRPPDRSFPPRPRRLAPGESNVLDPWAI